MSAYKFHTLLPQDFEAQARFLFHGSTHNRWFDKCVNLVVSSSGAVGANVEHSALDATVRRGCGSVWCLWGLSVQSVSTCTCV